MEPTETWCDLAERWADEDAAEARARRFARKLDRLAERLGMSRSRLAAWLTAQGAAA